METTSTRWLIDTINQYHMCKSENNLHGGKKEKYDQGIVDIVKGYLECVETMEGYIKPNYPENNIYLKEVKIIPALRHNIISTSQLMKDGCSIMFNQEGCIIETNKGELIRGIETELGYEIIIHETVENDAQQDCETTQDIKLTNNVDNIEEPEDWKDVLRRPQEEQIVWHNAMREEISNMEKNKVWTIQSPPTNMKPINCRWTFSLKRDHLGKINKIRARLVAKGCGQTYGLNYDETYAPVIKHESIRTLMTIAGKHKLYTQHCDINSAFLYGELDETIYMKGPDGPWEDINRNIYKLNKSIYGLKQAARIWNTKINQSLTNNDYVQSMADPCLYIKNQTFILIHVDDLLIIGPDQIVINQTVAHLKLEYEIKTLGPVTCYLGIIMEWNKEASCYYIHQNPKIEKLVNKYGLKDSMDKAIPMEPGFLKGSINSTSELLDTNTEFQQLVGSLMYLGLVSRPDIHLAANLLGRKASKPTTCDWKAALRVIQYLKGTHKIKLKLGGPFDLELKSYCDADWGGDLESRKSTSGQIHLLGQSAISWRSKKQTCIALSTAEAEYVSSAICTQETIWIHRLLQDLNQTQKLPTKIFTDSLSGINMASSYKLSNRTKHIDLKYFFLRDHVEKRTVDLVFVSSREQTADIFTKPLPRETFQYHRRNIGLMNDGTRVEEEC